MITDEDTLRHLIQARHSHPHAVLGMHQSHDKEGGIRVRALLQSAKSCEVVDYTAEPEKRYPMTKVIDEGVFEAHIVDHDQVFPYRLRVEQNNGEVHQFYDPYSFSPTISEEDLYFFNEGTLHKAYELLGAHPREIKGIGGIAFTVWAPNAKRVSVVGDFNRWDGRYHPMRALGNSGVWELFIPGLETGHKYKYEIIGEGQELYIKADPYAVRCESPPNNASMIWDLKDYQWGDDEWINKREETNWKEQPISVYEVHFGSWRRVVEDSNRPFTYQEMASQLPRYVKKMGFTHVEFMPLAEHPYSGSWGYQVTGFFAPTYRFGTPQDFMHLVDTLHQHGIGVLMDWVPAHFPKDSFALAEFDGSHLYEHADPRQGQHQDWGTLIFNYSRCEVRSFLINSALSWMDRYHIDGLRVDAVASMLYLDYSRKHDQWIPNQYGGRENIEAIGLLRTINDLAHKYHPGVLMIAEESTSFGGVTKSTSEWGLGFDLKWNLGWMHDTIKYFSNDPVHRKHHHNELTFGMLYQNSENFMQIFSHDEVVHGKGSMIMKMSTGSMSEKAQTLRALYAYMWFWPGKKGLFMGSEFGQSNEWHYDQSLDWHLLQYQDHLGIQAIVRDLNELYKKHSSLGKGDLKPEGFEWVNADDSDNSVISFIRLGENPKETFLTVCNFTPVQRFPYRLGVPHKGLWKEIMNSNAEIYGGNGAGNLGGKEADETGYHGREYSVELSLPGLSTLVFKYEG